MSFFDRFRRRNVADAEHVASSEDEAQVDTVEGERSTSTVQRPPSLQSRVSNVLALGLMGALGLGLLGWYYAHSAGKRDSARAAVQSSAKEKAKGEVKARPLGPIEQPVVASAPTDSALDDLLGGPPEEPPPSDIPAAWLQPAVEVGSATAPASSATKTPRDLQLERQLSGRAFFVAQSEGEALTEGEGSEGAAEAPSGGDDLTALMRPSVTKAALAQVLPTRRLLLPKGAFIDCTLETAIDTTLPGMTTCILATDAFSADGSVVLLERGTKLVGEVRGQVRQGSARVFVLWAEARTPTGVIVPLASPGTDELGRSGLPGAVNRHFFERFGAAILISVIDGAIQGAVAAQRAEGDTVTVDSSGSQDIMTEILKSTVNIPPTVVKPQGDRIQVFVARDLDFRSTYELRPAAAGR